MNILILTNPEYKEFISGVCVKNINSDNVFMDWFGNKFIFLENLSGWYDIGISFMYQHKVPAKEVNTHTWFNFHPAPLPEYKGRNLCYHAIMNGEKEFGATLHYMDENFDTGNIISVAKFDIDESWTAEDLSRQAIEESKWLFERAFPRIISGEIFPSFPNVGGTYYPKEPIQDLYAFPKGSMIDFFVRAVTYKNFYPKIVIGGVTYKIVKDE